MGKLELKKKKDDPNPLNNVLRTSTVSQQDEDDSFTISRTSSMQSVKSKSSHQTGGRVSTNSVHAAGTAISLNIPPVSASMKAPGKAMVLAPPARKVEKSLWEKTKAFLHLESKSDKAKQRVGVTKEHEKERAEVPKKAKDILKTLNPKKKVTVKRSSRGDLYYRKRDCQLTAELIKDDYNDILEQKKAASEIMKGLNPKDFAKALKDMTKCQINFMCFKNDENFLKHYKESMDEMSNYASYTQLLMKMTEADLKKLMKDTKVDLPDLKTLQHQAMSYTYAMEWYQGKFSLINNKNYLYLKESDLEDLEDEELEQKAQQASTKGDTELADYIKAVLKMRGAEALGAKHTGDDRSKWRSWGNSGRTGHKWGIELFSAKKDFEYPDSEVLKSPKKLAAYILGLDVKTKNDILKSWRLSEKELQEGNTQEIEKIDKDKFMKKLVTLEKEYLEGEVKLKALKARYKYKKGHRNFDANMSVGAVNVSGSLGGSLTAGTQIAGGAKVGGAASATAVQGRIKAGLNYDNVGLNAKVGAKVATASAEGFAGAGKMKILNEDGEEVEVTGVAAMLSAQASLVEAEAQGSFTIFGIKIGASLEVEAGGLGGTLGGYANTGQIGATFGALAGVGFRLSIAVDWTGFIKWWKNRKKKKKLKKAQRDEMLDRIAKEDAAKGIAPGGGAPAGGAPAGGSAANGWTII